MKSTGEERATAYSNLMIILDAAEAAIERLREMGVETGIKFQFTPGSNPASFGDTTYVSTANMIGISAQSIYRETLHECI